MCFVNLIHTYHLPHHPFRAADQTVYEYIFNIPLKDGYSKVDGAEKCLIIVKQADGTKSTEIFPPGEYANLTNIICVQVKEEGGTGDIVLQSRSSN